MTQDMALERQRLRGKIDTMQRPAPGTSDLLSVPLRAETTAVGGRDVLVHDLLWMSPLALRREWNYLV